ncbi:hypothetical protein [Streptomyces nigrescens]
MAKHARHRKRNTKEDKKQAQERRERAMLAVRIALLIGDITRSVNGDN